MYKGSEKQKEYQREYFRKYRKTEHGMAVIKRGQKRHNKTRKYKETREKYHQTPRGIEVNRKIKLKNKYGISLNEYNKLLEQQNGKCIICLEYPKDNNKLCVDHNHLTTKVRGLLCDNCNKGIGFLKESIEILGKAQEYLRKHGVGVV